MSDWWFGRQGGGLIAFSRWAVPVEAARHCGGIHSIQAERRIGTHGVWMNGRVEGEKCGGLCRVVIADRKESWNDQKAVIESGEWRWCCTG